MKKHPLFGQAHLWPHTPFVHIHDNMGHTEWWYGGTTECSKGCRIQKLREVSASSEIFLAGTAVFLEFLFWNSVALNQTFKLLYAPVLQRSSVFMGNAILIDLKTINNTIIYHHLFLSVKILESHHGLCPVEEVQLVLYWPKELCALDARQLWKQIKNCRESTGLVHFIVKICFPVPAFCFFRCTV